MNFFLFIYFILAVVAYGYINSRLIAYDRRCRFDAITMGAMWPTALFVILTDADPNPFKYGWKL